MLFSEYLKEFKDYREDDLMMIDANEAIDIENKHIKIISFSIEPSENIILKRKKDFTPYSIKSSKII